VGRHRRRPRPQLATTAGQLIVVVAGAGRRCEAPVLAVRPHHQVQVASECFKSS
jgi:hypothetical protein